MQWHISETRLKFLNWKNCWLERKKKYVRYEEGAVLYSMGKNSFRQVAQDAHAIVRLKRIALVNVEVLDEYLESFRE